MASTDPRIDAYIAKSADFAKPILTHLRGLIHKAVPKVEETIKWGMPFFVHAGEPLCSFAAFKQHAVFGFWKAKLMKDPQLMANAASEGAMGQLGRLTSLEDLPSNKVILGYLKEAAALNEQGAKVPNNRVSDAPLKIPSDLQKALAKNAKAKEHFKKFTPGKKRDYVNWLEEAKTDATRQKRLTTAVEWISEGKSRNWKYEKPSR